MIKKVFYSLMLLSLAFLLPALMILSLLIFPAQAQEGSATPTPDPVTAVVDAYERYRDLASVEGDSTAQFALLETQFISNYPDGFEFIGKANSSAGELASVSIFYSHNPRYEEDFRMRGEVDAVTGEMQVSVAGIDADDIPPWVEVNYRWRISDSAGNVYWSQWFTGAEYADNTRGWERRETDDVVVFIEEGIDHAVLDYIADAMAEQRELYRAGFGRLLSFKPRVILFADFDSFDEWRGFNYLSGNVRAVGFSSGTWGGTVQVANDDLYNLAYATVVHEIAHQYQFDVYESNAPSWFQEGIATYYELAKDYDYEGRARDLAVANQLPLLFTADGGPAAGDVGADGRGRVAYDVGYAFILWLVENYGIDAHRRIAENIGARDIPGIQFELLQAFNEAVEEVLGLPVTEVERQFRIWMGAGGDIPTLIPTPTLLMRFPPTSTPAN